MFREEMTNVNMKYTKQKNRLTNKKWPLTENLNNTM